MFDIVKFYENIQQKTGLFDILSFHRKYSYLNKYKDKKILIIGTKKHPKYNTCESFKPVENHLYRKTLRLLVVSVSCLASDMLLAMYNI